MCAGAHASVYKRKPMINLKHYASEAAHLVFESGFCIGLGLTYSARLAGQQSPRDLLVSASPA